MTVFSYSLLKKANILYAKKKVVVLGMGGTIAGKALNVSDNIRYTAALLGVDDLLLSAQGALPPCEIEMEQVAQLDSKDMSMSALSMLAQRVVHWLSLPEVQGVVVTHGTDTLEETAFFLQQVCSPVKPVVLTCAMRPATALAPDGPQNLRDALTVAQDDIASGVVVVCAGRVHAARDVQKSHTYLLDAFTSGDAGCVAYIEEGTLRRVGRWPVPGDDLVVDALKKLNQMPRGSDDDWPRVEIVMNYVGASGNVVDALVRLGVQGIVVAGTGNGTIHRSLEDALVVANSRGIAVVRSTRCANGRVLPILGSRFLDSAGLSPVKARIALILHLLTTRR